MRARTTALLLILVMLLLAGCGGGFRRWLTFITPQNEPGRAPVTGQALPSATATAAPAQTLTPHPLPTGPAVETPPPDTAPLDTAPMLKAQTVQESSVSPRYEFTARYPVLEWNGDPRAAAFNQAAEDFVREQQRMFAGNIQSFANDPAFDEWTSTLKIDFTPSSSGDGLVSVLFKISYYTAGAAHPGSYHSALNYDLRAGRVLALEDLFNPGSAYLEKISAACMDDLDRQGVLEWKEGAEPRAENYQVWNITPQGLLVTFDEYQVASYAQGPQSVILPYQTLRPLLRADGPVGGQAR